MPTYTYKREDGSLFEVEQKISDAPLTTCPTTGQPVKRVIRGGAGLVFKGSGFYLTDYARGNNNQGSNGATTDGKVKKATAETDATSASKPAEPAKSSKKDDD